MLTEYEYYKYTYENKPELFMLIMGYDEHSYSIDDKFFAENYQQIFESKYYSFYTASNFVKKLSKSVGANNISDEFCKRLFLDSSEYSLKQLVELGFDTSSIEAKFSLLSKWYKTVPTEISSEEFEQIINLNKFGRFKPGYFEDEYFKIKYIFEALINSRIATERKIDILIDNKKYIYKLLELGEQKDIQNGVNEKVKRVQYVFSILTKPFRATERLDSTKKALNPNDKYFFFLKEYVAKNDSINLLLDLITDSFSDFPDLREILLPENYDLKFDPEYLISSKVLLNKISKTDIYSDDKYHCNNLVYKEFCIQNSLYDVSDIIMVYSILEGSNHKNKINIVKRIFKYTNIKYQDIDKVLRA